MHLLVIVDERNTFDITIFLKNKYVYINNLVEIIAASTQKYLCIPAQN